MTMTEVTAPASQNTAPQNMAQTVQNNQAQEKDRTASDTLFGEDGLTFLDVLDVINPLQHIPVVNTMYREITGDEISGAARMAGGTLYGGVFGLLASAVNWVVDELTGDDVGGHVMTALNGGGDESDPSQMSAPIIQAAQRSTNSEREQFLADPIAFVLGGSENTSQQPLSAPDPIAQNAASPPQEVVQSSLVQSSVVQTSAAGRIGVWDHAAYEVPPVYDIAAATNAPKTTPPIAVDKLPAEQMAALKAYASDIQALRAQMMAVPK